MQLGQYSEKAYLDTNNHVLYFFNSWKALEAFQVETESGDDISAILAHNPAIGTENELSLFQNRGTNAWRITAGDLCWNNKSTNGIGKTREKHVRIREVIDWVP